MLGVKVQVHDLVHTEAVSNFAEALHVLVVSGGRQYRPD